MNILLKLKHWQLFLYILIPLIVFKIMSLEFVYAKDLSLGSNLFPIVFLLTAGVIFAWLYTTTINLHKRLAQGITMNLTKFRVAFGIALLYVITLAILFWISQNQSTWFGGPPGKFELLMMLQFIAYASIIYCVYFTAKLLKSVERQSTVKFEDYAGEFFLILFLPVGIWFIQPRINRLFEIN